MCTKNVDEIDSRKKLNADKKRLKVDEQLCDYYIKRVPLRLNGYRDHVDFKTALKECPKLMMTRHFLKFKQI